ncbi:uncharacterized protein LOC107620712 [Arachis ipaensis]|uniref:uncharacterized protein LOC107620712 n=1 Tax=Arachis ipaensis TaxID=130454 RepID=UPI0007AF95C9|nr:uncharacterized protein LOC107620712 [Arachis ipaensis]
MANLANTMEANATATLQAVQRLGQPARNGNGDGNENDNAKGNGDNIGGALMTFASFLKVHPPSFKGSTKPTEADNWFQAIESFYKNYFPESAREVKEMELMQLKQGSLLVVDYTSQFEELCRFSRACQGAPETYESWKCIKYQRDLKDNVMTAVAPLEIRTSSDLVKKARVVEEYAKTVASSRDTHGGNINRGCGDYLRPKGQNFKRNEYTAQHLRGQGDFRRNDNAQFHMAKGNDRCYTCGLPGHLAKDCGRGRNRDVGRSQQPGRDFTMNAGEATESDLLIRGKQIKLL